MLTPKAQKYILIISGIILVSGCIAYILKNELAVYMVGFGAIGLTIIKIKNLSYSVNFRIRRLQKISALSTILLLATVYLMYIQRKEWALTLLLSAIIDLIVSYRMPKDENEK